MAWLDVKEFTPASGGSTLFMLYESAPTKDEIFFAPLVVPAPLTLGVTTTAMLKDMALFPLARWFRWTLAISGPGVAWDATFRLLVAANRIGSRGA
ncbi:MAG: hypothetical protein ACLP1X_25215 [Polyangiaceae bacterium]